MLAVIYKHVRNTAVHTKDVFTAKHRLIPVSYIVGLVSERHHHHHLLFTANFQVNLAFYSKLSPT